MMQRTQLMIDDQLKQDLLFLSQETNQSMSQVVRNLLREKVREEKKKVKRKKMVNPAKIILAFAKKMEALDRKYGNEGPRDWSINHDYYLYGLPKRK